MGHFTKPLTVTKVDSTHWRVDVEFAYEDESNSIVVPNGFITDFASVPRIFQSIIPKDGKYTQAAVLHDYLYVSHIRDRKTSDKLFFDAMTSLHVPITQKYIIYWSVCLFGGAVWKRKGGKP